MLMPAFVVSLAFFLIPLGALLSLSFAQDADNGRFAHYIAMVSEPRYWYALISTVLLAVAVTVVSLLLSVISGLFLVRNHFWGRSILIALLTFPLAFPGVVVGFFIIMLAGRQGLLAQFGLLVSGERWVFAYSIIGLFLGYVYFSIPRVIVNVIAGAEKIDVALLEAARSLHAPPWRVFLDVTLPALKPGLIASGSICFATAMGAFGTAFTLAADISVIPMVIYGEFTLNANFAMAAALSVVLAITTWICLWIAERYQGNTVAMGA